MLNEFGLVRGLACILCASFSLAAASPVVAQGLSKAQELEAQCKAVDDPSDVDRASAALQCLGFVAGVADGIGLMQGLMAAALQISQREVPFGPCFPDGGLSADQSRRVYLKYMADHPEELHLPSRAILFKALVSAFPPCQKDR
jgi:hypothetical protein